MHGAMRCAAAKALISIGALCTWACASGGNDAQPTPDDPAPSMANTAAASSDDPVLTPPTAHTSAVSTPASSTALQAASPPGTNQPLPPASQMEMVPSGECAPAAAGDLFTQRIAPLLAEDRPSSCNGCHLSGVNLGGFVRDDACESMACLVADGLVDLENPESSTLLSWIRRASPNSPLITQTIIDEEYAGVLDWIEFSARCGAQACAGVSCGPRDRAPHCEDEPLPAMPSAANLPSDCSAQSIEQLFKTSVYAQRGRCSPCHVDSEAHMGMPGSPWIHVDGSCDQGALETLRDIERLGLMNLADPAQSLLLLKPLADQVAHAGSAKFHDENDPTYRAFYTFIDYYARCQGQPPVP